MTSSWNPDLSYGNKGDYFGAQDYFRGLKKIWDAEGPSSGRQDKLVDYRRKVLDWMGQEENLGKIHSSNRLGAGSGLGHDIAKGEHTWNFQGTGRGTVTDEFGNTKDTRHESADWYGDADMMAARAAGHDWTSIKGFLDENQGKLRLGNVKGAGGVYDKVATEARIEGQVGDFSDQLTEAQEDWTQQFSNIETNVSDMGTSISESFEEGMGGVSDAISAQTAAEERYRADQANWQRRQENMQQMMIQEGRRKAREKPVMAVMPGASSYGGGGGGASAFARKKKQTTGLNIA